MTRIFIVEGLPCSGKSTTAKYVTGRLMAMGRKVLCVDEGTGEHPADYEQSAYVTGGQLAGFPPGLREMIRSRSEPRLDGYVTPLSALGGAALQRLMPYKIYDALPWETERLVMLDKWKSFTESAQEHLIYVFNAVLLQNPMCETMMRFGFAQEQSLEYIRSIAEIIAPLEPAVIYLKSGDIAENIRAAAEERPGWLDEVISYHVNGAYGKSIGAKGFDGYIACLEERQRRELEILPELGLQSLVLDGPRQEWNNRICSFIGVRPRTF